MLSFLHRIFRLPTTLPREEAEGSVRAWLASSERARPVPLGTR